MGCPVYLGWRAAFADQAQSLPQIETSCPTTNCGNKPVSSRLIAKTYI